MPQKQENCFLAYISKVTDRVGKFNKITFSNRQIKSKKHSLWPLAKEERHPINKWRILYSIHT